jgi:protein O-GlcNAc transferase
MSAQDPRQIAAISDHAHALLEQGRPDEALAFYRQALLLDPTSTTALANLSNAVFTSTPAETLQQRLSRMFGRSTTDRSVGALLHARLAAFQWEHYDEIRTFVLDGIDSGRAATAPFWLLSIADSAEVQYRCAREFIKTTFPPAPTVVPQPGVHGKLRIAYISGDFGSHAVSILMAGILELHDRERFEVIGASLRPAESSFLGQRVRAAFDRFIDCSTRSDAQIVALLRDCEVHIAVDLMGLTAGARTAIFSQRCAPLQVNYLGFPGTMGAPFMDYLLGDRFAIPAEQRDCYAERIVCLPDCFQANDRSRPRTEPVARDQCGLPPGGVVLCCFNSAFKISPRMCDIWCRILARVPDCVLWVFADGSARENFRKEVVRRGVDPRRVCFGRRVTFEDYLARMQTADLFLDTFPFNGGTTAADALWCGLPVLTCAGEALASRMAGSLLMSLGLPELVTDNLSDYEFQAIRLASDPVLLADLRRRLADGRDRARVFDARRFSRNLEAAYEIMWERHQRGKPPAHFSVPCGDSPA